MSEKDDKNLQAQSADDTIPNDGNTVSQQSAVPSGTEDTQASAYEKVIAQQQGIIDALIAQNEQLSNSIEKAIRQGAAFTDGGKSMAKPSDSNVGSGAAAIGMYPQQAEDMREPYVPLKDMDFSLKKSDIL